MTATQTQPDASSQAASISISLDEVLKNSPYITDLTSFLREKDDVKALKYWIDEYENPENLTTKDSVRFALDRRIAEIDHAINDQLNAVIHHPRFQKLESAWRGLWYLVIQSEGVKNFKIKILDISWAEIVRDIDRAMEFDQSQLFSKIYSDEYGTPGGEPYGVLIGDYEIHHRPSKSHPYNDIPTLKGICDVAAASFAPFIAGASSELFGLDDFSTFGSPIDIHKVFQQEEYIPWRALRDKADARFIGLTVPRILMRKPYRTKPGSYKGLFFYEKDKSNTTENYLWGNAAYGFAAILIREFASVGWFGHIRGVPRNQIGGGLLTNLPVDCFETDGDDIAYKPATDVVITDTTERELSDLGFTPLCQCYDTPFTAFYSNQSIQKPKYQRRNPDSDAVNAKLSSMLQHVLCGSRIAHYIKVMIRDKVGSFIGASDCEELLRNWLIKYTSGRKDLAWEDQARYPILESSVQVKEHPEKAGQYLCAIRIVPHYQLDQMVSELELVTELVQSK